MITLLCSLQADIFPSGFGGGGLWQNPNLSGNSLLNMNKMDMGHTLSFMAGGSSNSQGFYQSTYTNHIFYTVNEKLRFNIDLNFVNYGTATFSKDFDIEGNNDNKSNVVPAFNMQYKPSENTTIEFHFQYGGYRTFSPWTDFNERY
jgi:hypothetical protein